MIPTAAELLQGTVTSVSPLTIKADGDDKLTIPASALVVPRHLQNYTTTCTISGGTVKGGMTSTIEYIAYHTHTLNSFTDTNATITINNALVKGDRVHLLALQSGKKYVVLDRV
ncbi:MAG: DUF2577 domain-containing protein [Clostridiales bacterium]|nr:DUF2577 domain-containing protein [Clostridiales bacterium]